MPTAMATPQLPTATPTTKWKRPAKTTHDLPWADIVVLDMNKYDLPGGKQALAEELRDAVSNPTVAVGRTPAPGTH